MNPSSFHEGEGYAVGKADILILKFGEPINGSELILLFGSPYLEHTRGINSFQPLGRKNMARPPAQQRCCFIQDKVAGNKSLIPCFELLPKSRGRIMVLILGQVAGQKGASVNKYHILQVILVDIRIVIGADVHRHLSLVHSLVRK